MSEQPSLADLMRQRDSAREELDKMGGDFRVKELIDLGRLCQRLRQHVAAAQAGQSPLSGSDADRLDECERDMDTLWKFQSQRQPILVGKAMAALRKLDTAERALQERLARGLECDVESMFGGITARKGPTPDNDSNDAPLADKHRGVVTASFPDLELPDVETGFRGFGKAFVELWERLTERTIGGSSDVTGDRTV